MKEFDVLESGNALRVRATTRAGLVTASLQGLMNIISPRTSEMDEETERPFSVEADDFGALLAQLLSTAVDYAGANKESYMDVRLTLITDKKATGTFVATPASGFRNALVKPSGKLEVAKNEAGEWETKINLK